MKENKKEKINKKNMAIIIGISVLCIAAVLYLLFGRGNNFKISFDTDGGSQLNYQLVEEDGKLVKPTDPTKEGYIFEGWYVGDEEYDFDTPVTKDLTLVAKWKKVESSEEDNKFTVTFNTDGGEKVESKEVEKDETLTEPTNPTKEGYNFISWQLDGKDYDFNTKITKDITLIATWEKKITDTTNTVKHRVTFNSDGGSAVASKLVNKGSVVTKPTNPTKSGYTFLGWYLNNTAYNFNKGVYDNITLLAKWQQVFSNVTYSINWVKIESSSIGQYTLFIRSSEGNNVSGKARIVTTAGTTSVVDIPSTGKVFIKSAIESASVDSVN